ncbi:zinc finger protein 425-like isoform X2 [Topomyia yanbarensis]|nr:zinc finger protein 425-like isoform X2 [Topomyia yanbarensis]
MCHLNHMTDFELQRHRKLNHVTLSHNCNYCKSCRKAFKTSRGMQQHMIYCQNINPTKTFHCEVCDRYFQTNTNYINHLKHHQDFLCLFCNHGWITEEKLLKHVQYAHGDRLFRCNKCPRTERLRKSLNRHRRVTHNANQLELYCGHCSVDVGFKNLLTLNEHIHTEHKNQEQPSGVCDELLHESLFPKDIGLELETEIEKLKQDENQEIFLRHFDLVRNSTTTIHDTREVVLNHNKMILEEFLDEAFENDQIWTKYIEGGEEYLIDNYDFYLDGPSGKKSSKYKCPRCENSFDKQQRLTVHLAETHDIACLICNDCGASFNKILNYKSHRQEHLKDNARFRENIIPEAEEALSLVRQEEKNYDIHETDTSYVFSCKLCDRQFLKKCNLEKHQCSFYTKSELTIPKTATVALDPIAHESLFCTLCDKKFTSVSGLKYHLKRHTDIKAFPCLYCSKTFTANSNLNAHIRNVHSEHKSHICTECDMRFACKDHLAKHVRSKHRQERAFSCSECPKRYFQKSHLNDHMAAAHMGYKAFSCELCSSSYSCRGSLRRHVAKVHKIAKH